MMIVLISTLNHHPVSSQYHQQHNSMMPHVLTGAQISQILNEKLSNYDKRVRPNQGGEYTVTVAPFSPDVLLCSIMFLFN